MSNAATVNNIEEALQELGITDHTLKAEEKLALDEQGYVILPGLIDRAWLHQLRAAFEQMNEQQRAESGCQDAQESGTRHLENLVGKDPVFERVYTHPKLLAAVYYVLKRDFRLMQLAGRDPLPGFGQQALHADWKLQTPAEAHQNQAVNSLWCLDDFTTENGPTRIVPESHLLKRQPPKKLSTPASVHPQQISVIAPAGSVLIFNGFLWHSGTLNRSKQPRRVLNCFFTARENLSSSPVAPAVLEQISPAARYLLEV